MKLKNCGYLIVRKHREIKDVKKYTILDIYLDFGNMNNMKIKSWRSGKGLITYLSIKTIRRSKENKTEMYAISNVSMKDISKKINDFEKFRYKGYVRKRSKNEPTDSYFYLPRQLAKCMMRLNSHLGPVRTKINNTKNMNIYEMNTQKIPN